MARAEKIWAVVPVKSFAAAKQRLGAVLSAEQRRRVAETMLEDVLAALAQVRALSGIMVVTRDAVATAIARSIGARVFTNRAEEGQTAAVGAAAQWLARNGVDAMLMLPGDVPLVTAEEIASLLGAHGPAPAFSIVPAHDRRGSNAVLCSPPDAVPLRFGDDSFLSHLAAARRAGIEPTVFELPGIALDIDQPEDLARLAGTASPCPIGTLAWLEAAGIAEIFRSSQSCSSAV